MCNHKRPSVGFTEANVVQNADGCINAFVPYYANALHIKKRFNKFALQMIGLKC